MFFIDSKQNKKQDKNMKKNKKITKNETNIETERQIKNNFDHPTLILTENMLPTYAIKRGAVWHKNPLK